MRYDNVQEEWRIQAVERKADEAVRRLHEIDSLRSSVDRLEYTNRELSSEIAGLRSEFEIYKEVIRQGAEVI